MQDKIHGYRSYFEIGYDVGSQTDAAISDFEKNPIVRTDQERLWNAGNGGIMRLAPAIIASKNLEDAVRLAWISGRETHYSEVAEMGSQVFANILYRSLHETDKDEITKLEDFYFTTKDVEEVWLDNKWYVSDQVKTESKT